MPKRTTTTQLQLDSPKHDNIPKQTTPPKSNTPKPSTSTSTIETQKDQKIQSPQSPPKPITEPKPPMAMAPQPTPSPNEQQTDGKNVEALSPLKKQKEIERKVQAEEKTKPEIVEKKDETKNGLKDLVKEKTKDPMSNANITKSSEKTGMEKKKKQGGGSGSGGFLEKAREMKGMDTIMKTVKRLATDDYEDRQLLINIGVSVVVIVALGAYITYTYRSSAKAKN